MDIFFLLLFLLCVRQIQFHLLVGRALPERSLLKQLNNVIFGGAMMSGEEKSEKMMCFLSILLRHTSYYSDGRICLTSPQQWRQF
jgi:hypothetical protein